MKTMPTHPINVIAIISIVTRIVAIFAVATTAFIATGDIVADKVNVQKLGWQLVWNDEFNGANGTLPDASKWTPRIDGSGAGNQQLEFDTNNQNDYLDGQGHMVIESRRNTDPQYQCSYPQPGGTCEFTSAHLMTSKTFNFTYGYVEARIKLPSGQGVWPAFWLLGSNNASVGWPASGEIDIMENIGRQPNMISGTLHGPEADNSDYGLGKKYKLSSGNFSDAYHTFAAEWTPDSVSFFVDGINYFTVDKTTVEEHGTWVFDHPFYIILNDAIGGTGPGSPDASTAFPVQMSIDYVRVYSDNPMYP